MGYYRDFRELLAALDHAGLLFKITLPICKDTELHPLVRWQFRGLPESDRRAFLFENVRDARGRSYTASVAVGALAASREIFCVAMKAPPDILLEHLARAVMQPIPPMEVSTGPCQEEVHVGPGLLEHGGLEEFPVPISTPGLDSAPYTTFSHWISRDPETGLYNIGNYRGQLKAPDRIGCFTHYPQHLAIHWEKCRQLGKPLEVALVIGTTPNVSFAANTKVPYGVEEYGVAGAIAGGPVPVVRCQTVDLVAPATAEVVIEGLISTEWLETEAPFGETTGYMSQRVYTFYCDVTAITHRKRPVWASIMSQFPPSESTKLRQLSYEPAYYQHLKYRCNLPAVTDVAFYESCSSYYSCVVQIKKTNPAQPWQAIHAVLSYDSGSAKVVVVVDDDINPRDPDMVNWAIATRVRPEADVRIQPGRTAVMDFSYIHPEDPRGYAYPEPHGASALTIDATRKGPYSPTCLPLRPYMERARTIWKELGLPPLTAKEPWHGYFLEYWPAELQEEAEWAVRGEWQRAGDRAKTRRKPAGQDGHPLQDRP